MEIMLAEKLENFSKDELIDVLSKLMREDFEAFNLLKELIEDQL